MKSKVQLTQGLKFILAKNLLKMETLMQQQGLVQILLLKMAYLEAQIMASGLKMTDKQSISLPQMLTTLEPNLEFLLGLDRMV